MLIPNNLIKALARLQIHGNQWRLLWIIWDKTDKQKEAYISLPQFSEDTGLPPQLISRELIDLEKRNIIKRISLAVLKALPEEARPEFEKISGSGDEIKIQEFFKNTIPNFEELMHKTIKETIEEYKQIAGIK